MTFALGERRGLRVENRSIAELTMELASFTVRVAWPTMALLFYCRRLVFLVIAVCSGSFTPQIQGQTPQTAEVREAIARGAAYLRDRQQADGSFPADGLVTHPIDATCLATLALLESGQTTDSITVRGALHYLRSRPLQRIESTHEISLLILVWLATGEASDTSRAVELLPRLLERQAEGGGWMSRPGDGIVESSLSHLALLTLRDAAFAGLPVQRDVWERARQYWQTSQNAVGSWGELSTLVQQRPPEESNLAGRTLTAVTALSICQQMLSLDASISADGQVDCCRPLDADEALKRGIRWLQDQVRQRPAATELSIIYYLHGLEHSGRLGGQPFVAEEGWYARGVMALLQRQNRSTGHWDGNNPVISSSHALLFLTESLTPVIISKLRHGPRNPAQAGEILGEDWNHCPCDAGSLAALVSGRPHWPRKVTAQEVDLATLDPAAGLQALRRAPVLFMTGTAAPRLSASEIAVLKEYIQRGGILLAAPSCRGSEFESGFRELVGQLAPSMPWERLAADHPIYRTDVLVPAEEAPLWGVEAACRTSIIYARDDLGCLWSAQMRQKFPGRDPQIQSRIQCAAQIGVNILAYATGREPPLRFDVPQIPPASAGKAEGTADRGALRIAQIDHQGGWNTAPRALSNLLRALDQTAGITVPSSVNVITLDDPLLPEFPLISMHGRMSFSLSNSEREALRSYLNHGGVLFADACCGSESFDRSFRELANQLFPKEPLRRIPLTHELFSDQVGHDLQKVHLRSLASSESTPPAALNIQEIEPFLEGIELDGRYAVIYSRNDLSCALERQWATHCAGYHPEDAVRIVVNIVLYSLVQNVQLSPKAP